MSLSAQGPPPLDTSTNPFNDELATGLAVLASRFERV